MNKKKLVTYGSYGVLAIVLLLIISFAENNIDSQVVEEIEIGIDNNSQGAYIDDQDIKDMLNSFYPPAIEGNLLKHLEIEQLDSLIESSPFIKASKTYTNVQGKLFVDIDQQFPILRIINSNNESFYITDEGRKMPLSQRFTARVPVATGLIAEKPFPEDEFADQKAKELYAIAQYLDKHAFFKALTGQLFVNEKGDIVLITKAEERHDIILGSSENLDEKFDNLLQFYTKVLSVKGWDTYRTINLKFRNQIVAK